MARRILVVEDNSLNLELVTDILEMSGYEVLSSETAKAAIEVAAREQPDVVLMDIALPDMDGLEATRIMKSKSETRMIPVVALTAHAMSGDADRARNAGCDGYITKPINTKRFILEIESVLERTVRRGGREGQT